MAGNSDSGKPRIVPGGSGRTPPRTQPTSEILSNVRFKAARKAIATIADKSSTAAARRRERILFANADRAVKRQTTQAKKTRKKK